MTDRLPSSRHSHGAPPPTGLWLVVGALVGGPILTYLLASGTAASCGPTEDPLSCGLGASMGMGLIGFVFAVMATAAGFARLFGDLRETPRTTAHPGHLAGIGALLAAAGAAAMWYGFGVGGVTAAVCFVGGVHLALIGAAAQLRDACRRHWLVASRRGSGRERGEDNADQVVGELGRIEHGPRR